MFCPNCGASNSEEVKFCASCGGALNQSAQTPPPNQQQYGYTPPQQPQPVPGSFEDDVQKNKVFAIIAYFIFFVPLLAAKDSPFARYHANQGLILLLFSVALGIVNSILTTIFVFSFAWVLVGIIGTIFMLLGFGVMVLLILGIVNAAQGKMEPLPLIGRLFTIIK